MAFNMHNTDEDILRWLLDYEDGRKRPFIRNDFEPSQHPADLLTTASARDGRAYFYFYSKFDVSGSRWIQHRSEEAIRDVSEELGYKKTFKFANNGRSASNWSMTKYYLHRKSSSRKNKNAIYMICNT